MSAVGANEISNYAYLHDLLVEYAFTDLRTTTMRGKRVFDELKMEGIGHAADDGDVSESHRCSHTAFLAWWCKKCGYLVSIERALLIAFVSLRVCC